MHKDFDGWNKIKKALESRNPVFCNTREIWWCSLGANVGTETSGKNELFERPVLVLRVYNVNSIVVVPLTSVPKDDPFHFHITYEGKDGWIILSHARTISSKRLQRKLWRLDLQTFKKLNRIFFDLLRGQKNRNPARSGVSRSPKA